MKFLFPTLAIFVIAITQAQAAERPNILWITSEDNGPEIGCYGDTYADTPNIDAFAEKSLRYRTCWSNAPVCAPARTTIISGMYATSLGGQHMRSGVKIPVGMKLYPEVLREAGYYCTNNNKTDYNFNIPNDDVGWNDSSKKAHWRNRPDKETPFFSVFNFTVSHESKIRVRPHTPVHDPAKAPLPSYHPDTPEVRRDWAQYYDKVTEMDGDVGRVLTQLEKDGLADSTIVFYYGDHGSGMPRSKRWPFDSGLRVPMVLHVPEKFKDLAPADYAAGGWSERLVAFVDLAPTAISLAGGEIPANMQGVAFAGLQAGEPKKYLFGFRGRMDERIDMVRSCTDGRYVYMRHFYPERPYLKHVSYMFETPTTQVWKRMFDAGELNETQAKFWMPKPVEELFDLESDPDETINIAALPENAARVEQMRSAIKQHMIETGDIGLVPEAEMHRLAGDMAPRTWSQEHVDFAKISELAMAATDAKNGWSNEELIGLVADADPVVRWWAVRGLAIRDSSADRNSALTGAMSDDSPSVAIAACDGLLNSQSDRDAAVARLTKLANANQYGTYAPIAALNSLDMNANLDKTEKSQLVELPRKAKSSPSRGGEYVGRLLDDLK
ncbi:sulfatase-like hydrolase/transferase [Rubripirellula reticaptiva]|uniref:Sulfatase n=1 Tax=Rubripirellula reticaptiva TaxID=2528013 RepID=A0A5C6F5R3_9BACT|nr:sulfatase-like hydrolase/transferase [Rubripirellula reticaptiva]TWU55767.1 Sulfatase [Rubripirellula reticaptiva]